MRRSFHPAPVLGALFLGALLGCAGDGPSPAAPSTPESRAAAGDELFRRYCASCHGVSGRGDGPVAASLRLPPADLTRIAARRDGKFDAPATASYIDGRTRVVAHGSAEMPTWGRRFDDRLETSAADETKLAPGDIYLIVEYLRSIQRP
jgi:mono/diheme cytochrome c family protein